MKNKLSDMDLNNLVFGGRERQQTAPAETDEEMARRLQAEWAAPPARRRQQTNAYAPDAPSASRRRSPHRSRSPAPPKRRRSGSRSGSRRSGSRSGSRSGARPEKEEEDAYQEEDDDDADAEEPSTRKKPRPATPDDEDDRPPLEVTFKIGETDRYDHAKDCACSHCAQVRARPRTPPPAARSLPGSPVKPLAAREEPWQPCARCRPRQTKQETAKKKKGRKARRRREEAPAPPPPPPKRESPQDDAKKQSAARGRAFRSERRALARHGVGDAADPLNGGVYAETRRLRLRFARSPIHSWGVFTDEPIVQGTQVLEYRGEEIGLQVGERRQEMYERNGEIDYLFRVDDQLIVDATRMGSLARFVNHSCAPNCVSKIVPHAGRKKIVLYTKRDIEAGEELSYDYKFELEDEKIPCHCGAATCRGSLN